MPQPYHRFVYDEERRVVLGAFEEMYQSEAVEGFDSWDQEDVSQNWRRLVLAFIDAHAPRSILDVGCGKGAFTSRFEAERVVGVDVSETALAKARERLPQAEFRCLRAEEIQSITDHFDLAVCLETLSYIQGWRRLLIDLSVLADRLVLSLYLPPTPPIGYVKSFDDLREGVVASWNIETEALVVDRSVRGSQLLVLAEARSS